MLPVMLQAEGKHTTFQDMRIGHCNSVFEEISIFIQLSNSRLSARSA